MAINSVISKTCDLSEDLVEDKLRHALVSGDTNGDRFDITVTRGGVPIDMAGASVTAWFIRIANGKKLEESSTVTLTGSVSGSIASVTLPQSCYVEPGRFILTVKLNLSSVKHAIYVGSGVVLRSTTDTLVDPGKTIPSVEDLLSYISQLEQATKNANTAAGSANSAASSANSAASQANTAASQANEAAKNANDAIQKMTVMTEKWGNVTVTVEMLEPNSDPTCTVTDSENNVLFQFKLPRGKNGITPSFSIGEVTTVEYGSGSSATITGTDENPVLNLKLERGAPGEGGGNVVSVNGKFPDESGNVEIDVGEGTVKSVNGKFPDESGNVQIETGGGGGTGTVQSVNKIEPDQNGNVTITADDVGALHPYPDDETDVEFGVVVPINADLLGGNTKEEIEDGILRATDAKIKEVSLPVNYLYDGRDLSEVFFSINEMAEVVAAGDFSRIRVGDYWPITLSGTVYDYADKVNKVLSNTVFKFVVIPDFYINYGDTPLTAHHLLMCSFDLPPWTLKFRSDATTWYNTVTTNPWLGSHIYETFNNTSNGVLALMLATELAPYIFSGPNGNGMRALLETKASGVDAATSWSWMDRGRLFLPGEREVWGQDIRSEHMYGSGLSVQWPIFAGTFRHIIKTQVNDDSRCSWWTASSVSGNATHVCRVGLGGTPDAVLSTTTGVGAPVCFLFGKEDK